MNLPPVTLVPARSRAAGVAVPTFRQVLPQLSAELRRARRFEHPLTALVIGAARPRSERHRLRTTLFPSAEQGVATFSLLGSFLRNQLRETDCLTAAPELLAYAVFLTETDGTGARQLARRLQEGFERCAGVALTWGSAVFPVDGLTLDDLFDCACEAWQSVDRPGASPQATR